MQCVAFHFLNMSDDVSSSHIPQWDFTDWFDFPIVNTWSLPKNESKNVGMLHKVETMSRQMHTVIKEVVQRKSMWLFGQAVY